MDNASLGVILVVVAAVFVAIVVWLASQYKHRRVAPEAAQWIPVEATIESGALEGTRESDRVVLPTLAFSYKVSDQYYSGRFSLRAHLSRAPAESMIGKMVGRKVLVRYDPMRPEQWFIPDRLIDGYSVEQNLGSHVFHDYSPRD
jgi:Protein of unknown function (DUF3592)